MFRYPATSMFDAAGKERVVWSMEEAKAAFDSGWAFKKPSEEQVAEAANVKDSHAKLVAKLSELEAENKALKAKQKP